MIRVTIDNRIRVDGASSDLMRDLEREFSHPNPDFWKMRNLGFNHRPPPRELPTWKPHPNRGISVPRGGWARVRALLRRHDVRFEVRSNVSDGDSTLGEIPRHQIALFDYQQRMKQKMHADQFGLARAPAGSGKTTLLLSLIADVNLPTVVVVSDLNLVTQWVDRVAAELQVSKDWVGVIQGKTRRLSPITIAMMQTLEHCVEDYARVFGMVACDEVQRAAAATLYRVIDQLHARYRLGVSDDEHRADKKEFLIYDLFGPVIAEADYDELVAAGMVLDVDIVVIPTEFDVDWYHQLDDSARAMAHQKVLDLMEEDEARERLVVEAAAGYAESGAPTLVMTNRRDHVMKIDRALGDAGVKSGFILGGTKLRRESNRTVTQLREGQLCAAVGTYKAIGTGVDLPKLSRGVFATPIANSKGGRSQFKQYRGRFARRGKSNAEVTYLWDVRLFGSRPLANLCAWSKRVQVRWNGELRPGKQVLKEVRSAEAEREERGYNFYDSEPAR